MIYKGYVGEAVFDEEEKTIRGRVVNLRRDGINFESEHAARVEDEFRASVDEYLAFCREQNRDPEAPQDHGTTLALVPDDVASRKAVLKRGNRTPADSEGGQKKVG